MSAQRQRRRFTCVEWTHIATLVVNVATIAVCAFIVRDVGCRPARSAPEPYRPSGYVEVDMGGELITNGCGRPIRVPAAFIEDPRSTPCDEWVDGEAGWVLRPGGEYRRKR